MPWLGGTRGRITQTMYEKTISILQSDECSPFSSRVMRFKLLQDRRSLGMGYTAEVGGDCWAEGWTEMLASVMMLRDMLHG